MQAVVACRDDWIPWLHLAAEVESLFGSPMSRDEGFHAVLRRSIARGTAFCVREGLGQPGDKLLGALLFSPKPPVYRIGWLAVTASHRRSGVGRALILRAVGQVVGPCSLEVTTFAANEPEGMPARAFYGSIGLAPAELVDTPFGPRQVFRRDVPTGERALKRGDKPVDAVAPCE